MSSPEAPVRCEDCGERIFFAKSDATDEFIPVNAALSSHDAPGAVALVGGVVFGRVALVDHLINRGRNNEGPEDFPWYMPHRGTCRYAGDREVRHQ